MLAALVLGGCEQQDSRAARLVSVTDGDTIRAVVGGTEERVRYIGIDTPEAGEPCFGAATGANARLLERGPLRLEYDLERRDRYGRLLAYVYAGELFVNAELVRRGVAAPLAIAPNLRHAVEFRRAARRAPARCPL